MNIIYINTHDSGRFFSPYGYKLPTPNIEAFGRESILFRQAYCASPTCSPSRGALLTGQYPGSNGLVGLSHRGFSLHDYKHHIGTILKDNGYTTAVAGTEHIANVGLGNQHDMDYEVLPYDHVLGPAATDKDLENAESVSTFIREHDSTEGPFFISFGLWQMHREYPENHVEGYEPDYICIPGNLPDNSKTREDFAGYCSSAAIADQCVRVVIKALKEKGIYDDTLVIFTTDHGLPNPYSKCNLFDSGIGVGLMVRVPNSPVNGSAVDDLFSHVDIVPTICDLLSIPIPDRVQGISQKALIYGESQGIRDYIFAEVNHHVAFEPMKCLRTKSYKYIRVCHKYPATMLSNVDDSALKQLLNEHGHISWNRERSYLFDLTVDPAERNNLIDDPHYESVKNQMREKLESIMTNTENDNAGKTVEGTKILLNPPESVSPKEVYPPVFL